MSDNAATALDSGTVWSEDFADGFTIGRADSGAKWKLLEAGPLCFDDVIATTAADGLTVIPGGINAETGAPAFRQTLAPAPPDAEIPGVLDHIKWAATANHRSSRGFTGFDTPAGKTIHIEALVSGRTFGIDGQPFGDAVASPHMDFRLGATAMVTMDTETNVVFDFFLTNAGIFALYERAPFARDTFGNYASFSFAVPVAARSPDDWHRLAVSYDRDANTARWFVDGDQVLEVDRVGRRLDRRYMVIDVGGEEQVVTLNQLECGLGMFTLLDASFDGGPGLIDLYGYPQFFNTARGEPHPLDYLDPNSVATNRLFGQGAQVRCRRFTVSYR